MSEVTVTIVGNITKNPEIRTTNNGKLVTRLRVASTRKRHIEGQWVDGDRAYIDVDCWDYLAQNVNNTFGKGDRIIAQGRLRTDEWQDTEGKTRSFTKVVADSIGPDLRFATAVIHRIKNGGARAVDVENERRAREAEAADRDAAPNETNHFDDSVQRGGGAVDGGGDDPALADGATGGGAADAAEFYPNGGGASPDPAGHADETAVETEYAEVAS